MAAFGVKANAELHKRTVLPHICSLTLVISIEESSVRFEEAVKRFWTTVPALPNLHHQQADCLAQGPPW